MASFAAEAFVVTLIMVYAVTLFGPLLAATRPGPISEYEGGILVLAFLIAVLGWAISGAAYLLSLA